MDNTCAIYFAPERPAVCAPFQATEEYCGTSNGDALRLLEELELLMRG